MSRTYYAASKSDCRIRPYAEEIPGIRVLTRINLITWYEKVGKRKNLLLEE